MVVILLIAAWSITMIDKTVINYDLIRYLDQDTMTQRALRVMEEEFGSSEQLRLMFMDQDEETLENIVTELNDLPEIQFALHDASTDTRETNGTTYNLITVTLNSCDTAVFIPQLREMFSQVGTYYVGGAEATLLDIQKSVGEEIPIVMLIAVTIVILVLLLTSHAWLEPVVIIFVLAISIIINMGTNFIFADVSFITFAVSAILQLALSIDYAIMLIHTFNGCCDDGMAPREALVEALTQCFMRNSSSALTTVAGLLSLLFMSFTIGFDIGLVLSKGILISMLNVFLLMPSITLFMERPLRLTRHTPLKLGGEQLAHGIIKAKVPVAVVLCAVVLLGAYHSSQTVYSFTEESYTVDNTDTAVVNRVFGATTPIALLVPGGTDDEDYDQQRELVTNLQKLTLNDGTPAIDTISAMVTTGEAAITYYTAEDVAELSGMNITAVKLFFRLQGFGDEVRADKLLEAASSLTEDNEQVTELQETLNMARSVFEGPRYTRMLIDLNYTTSVEGFSAYMDELFAAIHEVYGDDYYITGIPMSNYDIGHAFEGDLLKVNAITFSAILCIVALSFKAFLLPLLLVFIIEGAILVNMGFSHFMGQFIYFMSYLICLSIQMGATIDYGILVSDQYRRLRQDGLVAENALTEALKRAVPTVLTSGMILTMAGFVIGQYCTIYYISSIGSLVSRGAFVSAILVLTLLPALLLICDRFIIKPQKNQLPKS